MLVVTVEVWPGGDVLKRHVIGTMNLTNLSPKLPEDSRYEGYIDGRHVVVDHARRDGAWELVRKALDA